METELVLFPLLIFSFSVDWSLADFLAIRQNSIGQVRYVMKNILKYIPFFGPYFVQVSLDTVNSFENVFKSKISKESILQMYFAGAYREK